ncbi:U4/U6 small nuclear ribonucleoprotein Prp31-like [Vespula maculifrons]|uniref:U4/U6 small nuclear ribonucleoprotein Prp31-like n=1 Tax=Vespula maculifrons TaxID=7453 RepID=A0ABD2D0U9_VESMC
MSFYYKSKNCFRKKISKEKLAREKLSNSKKLKKIMFKIEKYNGVPESIDPVKSNAEYQLIVEANNMTFDIDNEIADGIRKLIVLISFLIHTFIFIYSTLVHKRHILKRFPELKSLVIGSLRYVMTVRELGNNLDKAKNNKILQFFMQTIIIIHLLCSNSSDCNHTIFKRRRKISYMRSL